MGSWGYGNFESDDSLNMLGVWEDKIIATIREGFTFEHQESLYQGHGNAHIVANIDIIVILCEYTNSYVDLPLEEVIQWKKNYMETYDRITGRFSIETDIETAQKRRKVIQTTFDRLINLVKKLRLEDESF